ncbi:MAG: M15 family metallopeptidase [Prevotella sp.]|nr:MULTISPECIES: M15 family metallopeptidase [unclassified Prevotella]MCH3969512.1 M15 family metallopeptidase [Prevotella sp.]MCH4018889.1 M15 family metallopeptidase [Prevotella sp.]MCH4099498.1 M15 family metallopeptidase [Prevotella sp.]MCH4185778.1 M15 family metallopeptidase [Prevotella sp.]MCH4250798.1 M15 family metallopeptidase [Prevotella sp.]
MKRGSFLLSAVVFCFMGCAHAPKKAEGTLVPQVSKEPPVRSSFTTARLSKASSSSQPVLSKTAQSLARQGYVNVKDEDSTICVSLMYSRPDNFCGVVLYGDLREAYLHPKAARALKRAQAYLKSIRPDLSLIVFDAARPMHIQQEMWDRVKNTPEFFYVSNPAHGGGLHNYGLAVDVSLCNLKGDTLDMGTKIDFMGPAAHIDRENSLVRHHRISRQAEADRLLLRRVMRHAGWRALPTEWWHFNFCSRSVARKYYKVIP